MHKTLSSRIARLLSYGLCAGVLTAGPAAAEPTIRPLPTATPTRTPIIAHPVPIAPCGKICGLVMVSDADTWTPPGLPGYDALVSVKALCPAGKVPVGGGVKVYGDPNGVEVAFNGPAFEESGEPPAIGWDGAAFVNSVLYSLPDHGAFTVEAFAFCVTAQ